MENKNHLTLGMQGKAVIQPKLQLALLGLSPNSGDQDFPTALASGAVAC